MLVHYVELFFPGTLFAESAIEKIKNRRAKFKIPKNCFGFRFFDKEEVKAPDTNETLEGKPKNHSGMYFIGTRYTKKEVASKFPKQKILIANIQSNHWIAAVKTRVGNWQGLEKGDKVLLIGDMVHDYDVAKEIGADCFLISHGHQSKSILEKCGVPLFDTLNDLL